MDRMNTGRAKVSTSFRTTLYFPKKLHSRVRIEAIKRGISMTDLVIEAIENALKKTKKAK